MKTRIFILSAIFIFLFSTHALAGALAGGGEPTLQELVQEIRELQSRVTVLESKLAGQEVTIEETQKRIEALWKDGRHVDHKREVSGFLHHEGLSIGANTTGIVQGTSNSNNVGTGEDSQLDASWKTDIDIEQRFDDWGKALIELECGQGDTVNGELALFGAVNNNANNTRNNVIMNKFYYEHYLFDKQLTLTGGKLDATDYFDENKYANNDGWQFINQLFNNSRVLEWPATHSLGFRAEISPKEFKFMQFNAGYFEGTGNWEEIFDNGVYIAEVNLRPEYLLGQDPEQWGGNYRIQAWINDRPHAKLVDGGEAPSTKNKEVNYGFGLSWDQQITDVFGVFGRLGWQRPDLIPASGGPTLEWSWSVGGEMTGKYWGRDLDGIGIGVGQLIPSSAYKSATSRGAGEGHFEAYYRWQVNKHLGITPDFQVVWKPDGVGNTEQGDPDAIFVYGARAHVDF